MLPHVLTDVQCLNETQKYLRKVVHEVGLELSSTAVCKGVRRTRDGPFTLQHALTHHHWTASDIMQAIQQYRPTRKHRQHSKSHVKTPGVQPAEKISAGQRSETNEEPMAAEIKIK